MTSATRRPLTAHRWDDAVFLHWRRDPSALESLLPPGVRPDVVDGSAWVGLVAYRFADTRVPPLPSPGPVGRMTQVTLEVLTVDDDDRHGTVYRTIETDNVPAIVAARLGLGVPYRFARVGTRRLGDVIAHRSARLRGGAASAIRVRAVGGDVPAARHALADRAGIVARRAGRTTWWVRAHAPLDLRPVVVEELRGDLPDAVGMHGLFAAAPDSAMLAAPTDVTYTGGGTIR